MNCPHCGKALYLCAEPARAAPKRSARKTLRAEGVRLPGAGADTLPRPTPRPLFTPGKNAGRLGQALVTGTFCAALAALKATGPEGPVTCGLFTAGAVWTISLVGMDLIERVVGWTVEWKQFNRRLQYSLEERLGADLDDDGYIGEPPTSPQREDTRPVFVNVQTGPNTSKARLSELTVAQKRRLGTALAGGASFTRRSLCQERGIFPEEQYGRLVSKWVELGLLERLGRHQNASVQVTEAGWQFLLGR